MRIAIAGAHGQIARFLTRRLVANGHEVVGLIRDPQQASDLTEDGSHPAVISLEEATVQEVATVIQDCDAVVFAAGGGPTSGRARKWSVDLAGAILLADAAEAAGVRRYVMVSSMGAGTPEKVDPGVFQVYLYAKGGADADLRTRDLDWTIVRPGRLTDDAPTGHVDAGDVPRGDITRADVAEVLAATLATPGTIHKTFTVINGATSIAEAVTAV